MQLGRQVSGDEPERGVSACEIRGVGGDTWERQVSAQEAEDLKWSGRFLGGLRRDIGRNLQYYKSDWVDAFTDGNFQRTTASICFLFFACLSPALAFGNSYSTRLHGEMGVVEAILATAMSGVIFAMFSGQPLNIIGATGPKFAFIASFYDLCGVLDVDFLVARLWLGLWGALFLFLFAVFEVSCLMQWATRFMEEIFALYIGIIFVVQALQDIFGGMERGTDAGLLTILLGIGTCYLVIQLKEVQGRKLMNASLRGSISNFAVAISIVAVSALGKLSAFGNVDLEWLSVPSDFSPTRERSWLISPFGNEGLNAEGVKREFPVWAMFAMALPGIGFALLNYMDQNTTALLVNRPANAIRKPVGYHLDMLVLSILYVPCALFGIVFPAGSTVPALTHVISLTTYTERPIAGGGSQKVAVKVAEQRWTGTMIHVLIFCSLFAATVLENVPKAVLYGAFLYMGLSSRRGNQLWDRCMLWVNFEPNTYPRLPYVTRVKATRLHLYTLIQVLLLAGVYGLTRIKQTGVLFPFFVAALVPFRVFVLPLIFTTEELNVLDAHDDLPPDDDVKIDKTNLPAAFDDDTSTTAETEDRMSSKATLSSKVGESIMSV